MIHKDFEPYIDVEKRDQWVGIVSPDNVLMVAQSLKEQLGFDYLLDLCVVDYLTYGIGEWDTCGSTQGFSRARSEVEGSSEWDGPRFVVVCHLMALSTGTRLRLKIYLKEDLSMPTLSSIWPSSLWYEREAYDLFGVIFKDHPSLNRILTDYEFEGHPMRKDFPQIGTVQMRYDGEAEACMYEPVSIENRIGVPKVIRKDNRYVEHE